MKFNLTILSIIIISLSLVAMALSLVAAAPTIVLNSPADNTVIYDNPVSLNVSSNTTAALKIVNVSLFTNISGAFTRNQTRRLTASIAENASASLVGGGAIGQNQFSGVYFTPKADVTVVNITTIGGDTANTVYIKNSTLGVIGTATFSGSTATFSTPVTLLAGNYYYIHFTNTGGAWTHKCLNADPPLPINTNTFTFLNGSSDAGVSSPYITNYVYFCNLNTIGLSGVSNSTQIFTYNTTAGISTLWGVQSCDSSGACSYSANRTFTGSQADPTINLFYPNASIYFGYPGQNITLNYSVQTNATNISCVASYNNVNFSIPCFSNSSFILDVSPTLSISVNDSFGNTGNVTTNMTFNSFLTSVSYNHSVYSTTVDTITANISFDDNITSLSVNLWYNGTKYSMFKTSTLTVSTFNRTVSIPQVSTVGNVSFFFEVVTNLGTTNTTLYYQNVTGVSPIVILPGACSAGYNATQTFTFYQETNLTLINASTVTYNFQYGLTNSTSIVTSGTLTNVGGFSLCINNSAPTYTVGYGEVDYTASGFVNRRFYLFTGTRLTNVTVNNSLILLDSANAQQFQFTAQSNALTPYTSKYVQLLRWYPNLNTYTVVEMGLTDGTGSTVINVKTGDVDYRIGLFEQDGTLIQLAAPIRMVCLTSPCSYTLTVVPSNIDYTSIENIQYTLTYDVNTGEWLFTYNDPSQKTSIMNLTIWKDNPTQSFPVCSSTASGSIGVISCVTANYTGTLRAEVYRAASPPVLLVQKIIDLSTSAFTSTWGLWLSVILAIPIAIVFAFISPIAAIFGGVIALLPALYFGAVNWSIVSGFIVLGGVVAHFVKRVS